MTQRPENDTELMDAIRSQRIGSTVVFDARCWIRLPQGMWARYDEGKKRVRKQFAPVAQDQLVDMALDWINISGFNHGIKEGFRNECNCGGRTGAHETGDGLCFRFIVSGDEIPRNRRKKEIKTENGHTMAWVWDVSGSWCTEFTLFNQRLYVQHPSGDWSRPKSRCSKNSITA